MGGDMIKQSFIGKFLDYLYPPMYGFCKYSYNRIDCEHYNEYDNRCHIWDDEFGEHSSKCTGRRP